MFAPLLRGRPSGNPAKLRRELEAQTRRAPIQCGEPWPVLADRQCDRPGAVGHGRPTRRPAVVAAPGAGRRRRQQGTRVGSGLKNVAKNALRNQGERYRAFKFKVGFGADSRSRISRCAHGSTRHGSSQASASSLETCGRRQPRHRRPGALAEAVGAQESRHDRALCASEGSVLSAPGSERVLVPHCWSREFWTRAARRPTRWSCRAGRYQTQKASKNAPEP